MPAAASRSMNNAQSALELASHEILRHADSLCHRLLFARLLSDMVTGLLTNSSRGGVCVVPFHVGLSVWPVRWGSQPSSCLPAPVMCTRRPRSAATRCLHSMSSVTKKPRRQIHPRCIPVFGNIRPFNNIPSRKGKESRKNSRPYKMTYRIHTHRAWMVCKG